MIKYYHFFDKATKTYFFVANDNLRDATAHANGWFEDPILCNVIDDKNIVSLFDEDIY